MICSYFCIVQNYGMRILIIKCNKYHEINKNCININGAVLLYPTCGARLSANS